MVEGLAWKRGPAPTGGQLVARGPVPHTRSDDHGAATGSVSVVGPGRVRVKTTDSYWTIDLAQARLLRTDVPIEPYFLSDDCWTPICALWAGCQSITVLDATGTYLSCRTVWDF